MIGWLKEVKTHPYIKEAERLIASDRSETIDKYSKNGQWDAKRVKEVHEPIIGHFLNPKAKPPEGQKPKLVMLIGPFGAGKTTAGTPYVQKTMKDYTLVNPDEIKTLMPEDEGWNATNLHEESSYLAKQIQSKALEQGHNILFDGSGQNGEKMAKMAEQHSKKGYDVHVVHVTVPSDISVYRAASRFLSNPFGAKNNKEPPSRYAPLDYVYHDVDSKPDETYDKLKTSQYVKSGVSLNNNKPKDQPVIKLDSFER
jgi:hypothetical protein